MGRTHGIERVSKNGYNGSMHPKFDHLRGTPTVGFDRFRSELLAIDTRAERVSFARQHGALVEFRRSATPGRMDIRIVLGDRVADAFDCSMENAARIIGRDQAGIDERLHLLDRDNAVERFYGCVQGLLDADGRTQAGRELALYVAGKEQLQEMILRLMDARLSAEQLDRATQLLNDRFDAKGPHHGVYASFLVGLPCGQQLKIKVWQNMENAMSFARG